MTLATSVIDALAERLDTAALTGRAIDKITDDVPDMSWADAYAIQRRLRTREQARGARVVGVKAGLTSFAKMQQMGVSEPVMGYLTDRGSLGADCTVVVADLIHPRIEAEIAFRLRAPLKGPGCHIAAALAAIETVHVAAEIIDSRYRDFRFDLKSVIADNTSAARYATGSGVAMRPGMDLADLGIVMEKNGAVVATASGAAVLGHPAASLAMLADLAAVQGEEIAAGALVLTGGATEAVAVAAGDVVTIRCQQLDPITIHFI